MKCHVAFISRHLLLFKNGLDSSDHRSIFIAQADCIELLTPHVRACRAAPTDPRFWLFRSGPPDRANMVCRFAGSAPGSRKKLTIAPLTITATEVMATNSRGRVSLRSCRFGKPGQARQGEQHQDVPGEPVKVEVEPGAAGQLKSCVPLGEPNARQQHSRLYQKPNRPCRPGRPVATSPVSSGATSRKRIFASSPPMRTRLLSTI